MNGHVKKKKIITQLYAGFRQTDRQTNRTRKILLSRFLCGEKKFIDSLPVSNRTLSF